MGASVEGHRHMERARRAVADLPVPVVSVIGKSDSGKTGVVERLVAELTRRGWDVATVKHHVHDFDIDIPGKDSWRHARAGARVSMVSSPDKLGVIRQVERERTLGELAGIASEAGADILVTEGFKREACVRIEVSRKARSEALLCMAEDLFAVATDDPARVPAGVPGFPLDDAHGLADLVERVFLGGDDSRRAEASGDSCDEEGGGR